jgi:hypothetical protein
MSGRFDFSEYGALLALVYNSLLAAALLGVVGGLVGVFVQMRDMQFAVHGISELSFAGAAGALLLGVNVALGSVLGSLIAGAVIGALGVRARDRNSVIGVLMPFGLGLGVLFLALYHRRAANKFGLLTGQIVAVDTVQLGWLIGTSVVVLVGLAFVWRPLTLVSADPEMAVARGVPAGLSLVFTLLLALGAIRTDDGETIYRRCSPQHHHHLICRGCGRTVEVEGPALERWADRIAAEHGFADVSHTLDVFGTCASCTTGTGAPPETPFGRATA